MDNSLTVGLLLILGFVTLITAMVILVWLARRRGRGVVMAGAILSILAPDPTLEQKTLMVKTAKVNQTEDDEQDEQ